MVHKHIILSLIAISASGMQGTYCLQNLQRQCMQMPYLSQITQLTDKLYQHRYRVGGALALAGALAYGGYKIWRASIPFERLFMSRKEGSVCKVEGFWADSPDPSKDMYNGQYPFPKAHDTRWNGQDEFIKKLTAI